MSTKDWPPQNTGLFAPPSCVTCCTPAPTEYPSWYISIFGVDGPNSLPTSADTYSCTFTPCARTAEGIIGYGTVTWTRQELVAVTDCSGCYGDPCYDDQGNQKGGSQAWAQVTHTWNFYATALVAGPGHASGVTIFQDTDGGATGQTNWPDCGGGSTTAPYAITRDFTW